MPSYALSIASLQQQVSKQLSMTPVIPVRGCMSSSKHAVMLEVSFVGGGFFNFLGFGRSANNLRDLQIKEVKNGRLAMVAVFGFGAQAVLTREGPFQNLLDHLSNPAANNILTNFGRIYNQAP